MLELALLLSLAAPSPAKDAYPRFAALKAAREEGKDYRVTVLDRGARVTVLAIHGGTIERGSGEAARAVAGSDWNLYLFEGLLEGPERRSLHITSTRFDDPEALRLAEKAEAAVSLHGARGSEKTACIGGRDRKLRKAAARRLEEAGFSVEQPCRRLPGRDRKNIVNRARRGLQVELTEGLRTELKGDSGRMSAFASALRAAVEGGLR